MTSDLLEENADLRKQVEELKDEIAIRNGKLAILISKNERLKGIVLGNEVEISDLKKSCDETQELLDKQIEATYKLDKENAELKKENEEMKKDLGCETCQIHLEYKSLNNRIANLKRENTELKDGRDINVFTKQLTKAKEIIKGLLSFVDSLGNYSGGIFAKAEQFLKEVENV